MRGALIPVLLLAACVAAPQPEPLGVVGPEGEPHGDGPVHLSPWPGPGPVNPAVIELLPDGVGADDVLLGSDGCYYYDQGGIQKPVRWDDDPTHFYCIG